MVESVRPLIGRTALVTGASRGIGAAVAMALLGEGAEVLRVSRGAVDSVPAAHDYRVDLADAGARAAFLDQVVNENGVPDIIVNNAGAFLLAALEETSDSLLREQLAINLEAPFAIGRKLLPLMRERGSGHHLIIGSVADAVAFPGNAAYSASKFGVRGLHQVLREEFRGSGVRFTLISPGPTDTDVWNPIDPDTRDDLPDREMMLQPEDVARAVLFAVTMRSGVQVESIRLAAAD